MEAQSSSTDLGGSSPGNCVLSAILPSSVSVAATREDVQDATLFREEAAAVARAVDRRRREFATGRACARKALERLGVGSVPILPGPRGEPRWPAGIVGSITHCDGFRGAAVARADDFAALGIDAEPDAGLPDGVLERIALPEERAQIAALVLEKPDVSWDRLLFSIKESTYKAYFPLAERRLSFADASVSIDRRAGTFSVRMLVRSPVLDDRRPNGFSGRWLTRDGLVLSAIAVRAGLAGSPQRGKAP
jgi:4'-phosphopantetheinyl transferase EntD